MPFRPLSLRDRSDPRFDGPQPGVPDYLLQAVWGWIGPFVHVYDPLMAHPDPDAGTLQAIQIGLRMEPTLDWSQGAYTAVRSLSARIESHRDFALDVLDYLLRFRASEDSAARLHQLLTAGGSEWEVVRHDGTFALAKRTVGPVAEVIEAVRPSSERAHEHLLLAWSKLAGRKPDPGGSYRESIRAVEAASKPLISPLNDRTTLGTVIRDIRAKPEKWEVALDHADAESVASVCALLWEGQIDRHGTDDLDTPVNVSQDEADTAFHLALALVRIFSGGLLREKT